jgi:hypothetical protein
MEVSIMCRESEGENVLMWQYNKKRREIMLKRGEKKEKKRGGGGTRTKQYSKA